MSRAVEEMAMSSMQTSLYLRRPVRARYLQRKPGFFQELKNKICDALSLLFPI